MGYNFLDIITENYWILILGLLALTVLLILLVWCIKTWRTGARYDYLTLQDDNSHDEIQKKAARKASMDASMTIGQNCLKGTSRYRIAKAFPDMGSRTDRYWFLVDDVLLKTDRLMTITTMSEKSPLLSFENNEIAKKAISELFLALQHPFVQPVLDIDFRMFKDQTYVILIFPYNKSGSLKDIIYNVKSQEYCSKKGLRGKAVQVAQIRTFGRQVLEAMFFLRDYRQFPPIGEHLHPGNVIVQDGVARLTGYENILLGFRSKINPILRKTFKTHPDDIDTIAFGHVIFEMCSGYSLDTIHPTQEQLDAVHPRFKEVLQVLRFLFSSDMKYPKLEEVASLNLFRHIDLREMHALPGPAILQPKFSPMLQKLIKQVWKSQRKRTMRYREDQGHDNTVFEHLEQPEMCIEDDLMMASEFEQDFCDDSRVPHPLLMHTSFSADGPFFKDNSDYLLSDADIHPSHLNVPRQSEMNGYISSSVPCGMYKSNALEWVHHQEDDYYISDRDNWMYSDVNHRTASPEYFSMDTVALVDRHSRQRSFYGTSV